MGWLPAVIAVVAVTVAVVAVMRGWDVRLVLVSTALLIAGGSEAAAAASLGGTTGAVAAVVRQFLATFSNEKFVVPICSAMGFAYVLKHTGCERHLVLLLMKPLRRVRSLLVPGVVIVGFLVNIPLVSQTSTAVCLGAVVVPLMRAAGYSMATIGACLLLGASVGGELLNPGAPELLTIFSYTKVETTLLSRRYAPLVFTHLAIATGVIWLLNFWWERREIHAAARIRDEGAGSTHVTDAQEVRINVLKALVPLVPIALLFASGLPDEYRLFDVPDEWVMTRKFDGTRNPAYSTRLIGLAMLIGVLVAMLAAPAKARDCVKEFFLGAGYGFANVVSLIVAATCFGVAIEGAGLAKLLGTLIRGAPDLMQPLAAFVPLAFAAVSGSGMASTQSLYGFFHAPAELLKIDPVSVGAMVSVGSAAGRTMSPVAAVTLMCAGLTGTNPFTLAKRVAVPLLTGIGTLVLLRLAGIL